MAVENIGIAKDSYVVEISKVLKLNEWQFQELTAFMRGVVRGKLAS